MCATFSYILLCRAEQRLQQRTHWRGSWGNGDIPCNIYIEGLYGEAGAPVPEMEMNSVGLKLDTCGLSCRATVCPRYFNEKSTGKLPYTFQLYVIQPWRFLKQIEVKYLTEHWSGWRTMSKPNPRNVKIWKGRIHYYYSLQPKTIAKKL